MRSFFYPIVYFVPFMVVSIVIVVLIEILFYSKKKKNGKRLKPMAIIVWRIYFVYVDA